MPGSEALRWTQYIHDGIQILGIFILEYLNATTNQRTGEIVHCHTIVFWTSWRFHFETGLANS